jgi:hypothetical protein
MSLRDSLAELSEFVGWIGILSAIFIFLVFLPQILSNISSSVSYIESTTSTGYNISSFLLVILLFVGTVLPILSILFLVRPMSNSISRESSKRSRGDFFIFFSILVLLDLALSFILTEIYPSLSTPDSFIVSKPVYIGLVDYYFNWLAVEFVMLELIPLILITIIALWSIKKLSIKAVIKPNLSKGSLLLGVLLPAWVLSNFLLFFSLGYSTDYVPDFISVSVTVLFVMIIYLRFGLNEAFLVSYVLNVLTTVSDVVAVHGNVVNNLIGISITTLILLWATVGILGLGYSIFHYYQNSTKLKDASRNRSKSRIPEIIEKDLWIRTSCPTCGGTTFKVQDDFSLLCNNCKSVVESNYEGPMNIKVEFRRNLR